jgi:general secretion pathway protein G
MRSNVSPAEVRIVNVNSLFLLQSSNTKRQSGFSLIEILVVVAIISILATFVALNVAKQPAKARIAKAQAEIEILRTALKLYRMDQGRYPEQGQGLDALVQIPTIKPIPARYPADGYLDRRKLRNDPWRNPYVYLIPGRDGEPFEIISYGADGEPGGEEERADISSSDS